MRFSVSGPNDPKAGSSVTNGSSVATYSYTGDTAGNDTVNI